MARFFAAGRISGSQENSLPGALPSPISIPERKQSRIPLPLLLYTGLPDWAGDPPLPTSPIPPLGAGRLTLEQKRSACVLPGAQTSELRNLYGMAPVLRCRKALHSPWELPPPDPAPSAHVHSEAETMQSSPPAPMRCEAAFLLQDPSDPECPGAKDLRSAGSPLREPELSGGRGRESGPRMIPGRYIRPRRRHTHLKISQGEITGFSPGERHGRECRRHSRLHTPQPPASPVSTTVPNTGSTAERPIPLLPAVSRLSSGKRDGPHAPPVPCPSPSDPLSRCPRSPFVHPDTAPGAESVCRQTTWENTFDMLPEI